MKKLLIAAEQKRKAKWSNNGEKSQTPMRGTVERSAPVLDFTTIARNIYSNEGRESIKSSQSCEVVESDDCQLLTIPDRLDTEPAMGSDVKNHFVKVQNAANSAAQIKEDLLARQSAIDHTNSRMSFEHARTDSRLVFL